ncbi:hypothetical protein [Deinococcus sp. QL22]|uniref:hypothetical protein n=1 Tax=Deinococcus sp. QL22 TaxID=2939437 RepID=UPI0020171C42|nr:hypothetical protein [Deinococcus sp. QL22]UQN06299.1 hypothetical protein M1R55_15790 [Deinococcus sp. QL22]
MRVEIKGCQRCGQDHPVDAQPLSNPTDQFTYWAMCPTVQEPLRIVVLTDGPPVRSPTARVLKED